MMIANTLPPPDEPSPTHVFPLGEVLAGNYELRGVLGAGGMGEVYEAFDRALQRRVAVKAAWKRGDPSLRKEAQVLAALRHQSMVTVHAIGTHGGVDFVVMERIYGVTLEAHLAQRKARGEKFPIGEACEILGAIADGLAVVHRAGIAHRDVKPSNVMLAPGNRVVLMDFGIFLSESDRDMAATTSGSPDYMAPETLLGKTEQGSGTLVDMYALGVVAFEMITGDVPYSGATLYALAEKHVSAPVPDLSLRRPDVPRALQRLIEELLAKDPSDRPPNMEAVAHRLRAARSPRPIELEAAPSVLIAEDDDAMAETLEAIVADVAPDAKIRIARDGEEALAMAMANAPDLLLLDLQMPNMNGLEVAMHLRGTRIADRCTIVAVSAGAQAHDLELLRQLGITRFVRKGPELLDRLTLLLEEMRRGRPPVSRR